MNWKRGMTLNPVSISLGYVVLSSIWILTSDYIAFNLGVDWLSPTVIQQAKGLFFVFVTGYLLHMVLKRYRSRLVSKDKEIKSLNTEVHHRVKNNLALITSLLELERDNRNLEGAYEDLLKHTIYKIKTIAIVHELQYQQESFSRIDLSGFLREFNEKVLLPISDSESMSVELKFGERQVGIDVKIAIPVALLIYELVVYAKKHLSGLVSGIFLNIYETPQNLYFSCHYETDHGQPLLDLERTDRLEIELTNAFLKQLDAYARVESDKTETVIYGEIPL